MGEGAGERGEKGLTKVQTLRTNLTLPASTFRSVQRVHFTITQLNFVRLPQLFRLPILIPSAAPRHTAPTNRPLNIPFPPAPLPLPRLPSVLRPPDTYYDSNAWVNPLQFHPLQTLHALVVRELDIFAGYLFGNIFFRIFFILPLVFIIDHTDFQGGFRLLLAPPEPLYHKF